MTELVVVVFVAVAVVAVVGIGLGMLVAPRIGRLAEPTTRSDVTTDD